MTTKQRDQRLTNLTLSEIADLKDDAVIYEGVGKMYVGLRIPSRLPTSTPRSPPWSLLQPT